MTTNPNDREKIQVWVLTTREAIDRAKKVAESKRMTFRGFLGEVIEKAIEEDNGKD